jgi:hypothetical protein
VFTAVGTYPFSDMAALLTALSDETGKPAAELLEYFGRHLFGRFSVLYGHMVDANTGTFELLGRIEDVIHVEVKKLYPDARLPTVETQMISPDTMELIYRSERSLGHLALGLIRGCAAHFNETVTVKMKNRAADGSEVSFLIRKT